MAKNEILTDDYVAALLAKDAKESSIRYSALGLDAFAGHSKPPATKPKPNTRFLRNIIKETDSHNAALLAKEAADSQARLQTLTTIDRPEQGVSRIVGKDIRRRQLGEIAAHLGGRPTNRTRLESLKVREQKGRRVGTSNENGEFTKNSSERSRRERSPSIKEKRDNYQRGSHKMSLIARDENSASSEPQRKRRRSISPYRVKHSEKPRRKHISEPGSRSRSRSKSPAKGHNRLRDEGSPRRKRRRSESPRPEKGRKSQNKLHTSESEGRNSRSSCLPSYSKLDPKLDDDSDPLDEIIGPRPPPIPELRSRGRGTVSQASGIDSRFSASYDPSIDVRLDPDDDNDWDQALEALQDRIKWKQQGADRLRAAGFTEDEVTKWERGGEKRQEDVKWAQKGEGREWDRGKVLDDDGVVSIKADFGRLKDT